MLSTGSNGTPDLETEPVEKDGEKIEKPNKSDVQKNEISFTPIPDDGVVADTDQIMNPQQGSFVTVEKKDKMQRSWVPTQGSFISTTESEEQSGACEINFSPAGTTDESAELLAFDPKPGSFVGKDDEGQNVVAENNRTAEGGRNSMASAGGRSLVVEREINFSPGGSELTTGRPPNQGSFVGGPLDHGDSVIPLKPPAENNGTGVRVLLENSMASIASQEINFSPGGSAFETAPPPKQGSFVGADGDDDALDSSSNNQKTGRESRSSVASREINFSPGGSDLTTASPPKHGSFIGDSTDEGRNHEDGSSPLEKVESVVRSVILNRSASREIDFNPGGSEMPTAPVTPKEGSFVGGESLIDRPVFVGDIYECGKGDEQLEEKLNNVSLIAVEGEDDDDSIIDFRAEDQFQWKASKDSEKSGGSGELLGIVESSEGEESDEAGATELTENVAVETAKGDDMKNESYHPNDSILAMEAMIESALNDDLFSAEEPTAEELTEIEKKDKDGDGGIENTALIVPIPAASDTAKVDSAIQEVDDLLELALADALNDPPKDNEAQTIGNIDTEDFVPDASIAKMQNEVGMALDDDDLALDELMQDSPVKSLESKPKRTIEVTDETDKALSSLLDGTLFEEEEMEITFGDSSDAAEVAAAKKVASKSAPKRGVTANPRVEDRPATKPTSRSKEIAKNPSQRRSFLSGTASSKVKASDDSIFTRSRTEPTGRDKQLVKKAGSSRRSFLSGTLLSKPTTSQTEHEKLSGRSRKPTRKPAVPRFLSGTLSSKSKTAKGDDEIRAADIKKDKVNQKKGGARRLMSAMTSWTKKTAPTKKMEQARSKSSASPDYNPHEVPPTNMRRAVSRPAPKKLFSGEGEHSQAPVAKLQVASQARNATPVVIVEKAEPLMKKVAPVSKVPSTLMNRPFPSSSPYGHAHSSGRSVTSLSSQCSVVNFQSPRKTGRFGCQSKFQPFLHESRGPCELCVFLLSDEDRALLDIKGRHFRVMNTSGGCCQTCELFPREHDEPPVRLCRQCFFNSHREMYRRVIPKRNLLRG